MDFLEHTLNWTRGEIFESTLIGAAGGILLALAILFARYGNGPGGRAVVMPLVVLGLIFLGSGLWQVRVNQNREIAFQQAHDLNPTAFVHTEKLRVEAFYPIYVQVRVGATLCFALALVLLWLARAHWIHAAALGLLILGSSALVIDYFSKERADAYYQVILRAEEASSSAVDMPCWWC